MPLRESTWTSAQGRGARSWRGPKPWSFIHRLTGRRMNRWAVWPASTGRSQGPHGAWNYVTRPSQRHSDSPARQEGLRQGSSRGSSPTPARRAGRLHERVCRSRAFPVSPALQGPRAARGHRLAVPQPATLGGRWANGVPAWRAALARGPGLRGLPQVAPLGSRIDCFTGFNGSRTGPSRRVRNRPTPFDATPKTADRFAPEGLARRPGAG